MPQKINSYYKTALSPHYNPQLSSYSRLPNTESTLICSTIFPLRQWHYPSLLIAHHHQPSMKMTAGANEFVYSPVELSKLCETRLSNGTVSWQHSSHDSAKNVAMQKRILKFANYLPYCQFLLWRPFLRFPDCFECLYHLLHSWLAAEFSEAIAQWPVGAHEAHSLSSCETRSLWRAYLQSAQCLRNLPLHWGDQAIQEIRNYNDI